MSDSAASDVPVQIPTRRSKTASLKTGLGLIVTIACLVWAIRAVTQEPGAWGRIIGAFQQANYLSLIPILFILVVFYFLKAWRWRLLLAPVGNYRPVKDLLGPIMIGFAMNNVLPARIGELIRVRALSKQKKIPFTVVATSLVLERVFDGMAIVFYLSIGLLFVEGLDARIQQAAYVFSILAAVVVAGSLIYVVWTDIFVRLFRVFFMAIPFVPEWLTLKFCQILEQGAKGLSALKDPRLVTAIIVVSLIKWGLNCVLVLLALWSFNLPHTLPIGMVLMGAIAFGVAIPSSPGYIGVMQVIFMEVMKFFTADSQAVFASSIYYQFTQWVPVTLIGLLYFAMSNMQLSSESETSSATALTTAPTPSTGDKQRTI